jgi:hypothetical protein
MEGVVLLAPMNERGLLYYGYRTSCQEIPTKLAKVNAWH